MNSSGCCGFHETAQPRGRQQVRLRHFRPLAQVEQHRHVRKPARGVHRRGSTASPARKDRPDAKRKHPGHAQHEQQRIAQPTEHEHRRQEVSVAAAEQDLATEDERDGAYADAAERAAEDWPTEEAEPPIWQQQQQYVRKQLQRLSSDQRQHHDEQQQQG